MSAELIQNPDGANFQAQAVLAMVRYKLGGGIEESWDAELHSYAARPKFTRFDNCREQGYVVYMTSKNYDKQINIAFYEHRNSDSIYVQVNNEHTFNAPTLDDIVTHMQDKWESSFSAECGEIESVAEFIVVTLRTFWHETSKTKSEPGSGVPTSQTPVDKAVQTETDSLLLKKS